MKAQEGKQTLNGMLAAAKTVAETELAGRRAKVAAAVLQEQGMLSVVKQPHSMKTTVIGSVGSEALPTEHDCDV